MRRPATATGLDFPLSDMSQTHRFRGGHEYGVDSEDHILHFGDVSREIKPYYMGDDWSRRYERELEKSTVTMPGSYPR